MVMQHKPQRPVQFELTSETRDVVQARFKLAGLRSEDFLLPSDAKDESTLIYLRNENLPAVQLLLGRSELEVIGRCLGIEVDNALRISAQTDS